MGVIGGAGSIMKYRSRDGIIMAILSEIDKRHGEARITEIMYKVFLSHYQLKKYMKKLKLAGVVTETEVTETHSRFSLTTKGIQLLYIYKEMEKAVPSINEPEP